MNRTFIGIGSNISPESNVPRALRMLKDTQILVCISSFYVTEPIGHPGQPLFYNGVAEILTVMPPGALRRSLRDIESTLGRVRTADRYAPRSVDLDILIYEDLVLDSAEFQIPDPDIHCRPFVAWPLAELAPDLILPGSTTTVESIARDLDRSGMRELVEFTRDLRKELRLARPVIRSDQWTVASVAWTSPAIQPALDLRKEVFVEEQKVPLEEEIDNVDPHAFHVVALNTQGQVCGTGRMYSDPEDPKCAHIGRMAVRKDSRHGGCGAALLSELIAEASRRGFRKAVLSAQEHAIPFYARFGFRITGPLYLDCAIPHRLMQRDL